MADPYDSGTYRRRIIMAENKQASGVLIIARDTGRMLLLLRSSDSSKPKTWALLSGGVEEEETHFEAVQRETQEEVGFDPSKIDYYYNGREYKGDLEFHFYLGFVDEEFIPVLDSENDDYTWVKKDNLPEPLFPGLEDKIESL